MVAEEILSSHMTTPGPSPAPAPAPVDLSKLRINRDAPSSREMSALWRNLLLFAVAATLIAAVIFYWRARNVPVVQVVIVSDSTSGASGARGATSVTANGYVVARTKASVSAKAPGRLAYLGVSEGSQVQRGQVIARLDNADFLAAVTQAEANIATADASVIEARADYDQLAREVKRMSDIHTTNANLVSQQELDVATSRAA